MSFSASGASEQQQHVKRNAPADVMEVFAALADQDRLTNCLAAAGCLAAARLVCRRLRDLVDGGVLSVRLAFNHEKVDTLEREQTLAALLRRWDRCGGLTVRLHGDWHDHASAVQAMPLWLFAGIPSDALVRIQAFTLSIPEVSGLSFIPLVSALAALMPSLRKLDLSGCHDDDVRGWPYNEGTGAHLHSLFYADLAASCPRLETLALPWAAELTGVEALVGSLVRLRVAGDDIGALPPEALRSISRLKRLRELSLKGLMVEGEDGEGGENDSTGSQLLHLLDSLPPSLELLELEEVFCGDDDDDDDVDIRFNFRSGRLQSVDVKDGRISCKPLQVLAWALLRCRATGEGVGTDPQQLRPSLGIRKVMIREYDKPVELGPLRERYDIAALDAISIESTNFRGPGPMAACAGSIVSVFGLPRKLRDWDGDGLELLLLGRAGDSALDGPAAGGSVAPVALATARVEDVLRLVTERLWADTDTSGAAGGQTPTTASSGELGSFAVLHGPCIEWQKVRAAISTQLRLMYDVEPFYCQWRRASPRFELARCGSGGTAAKLVAIASSPDGPCVREGIQVAQLRAGAVKSALQQVLLELWHGSATSRFMSQERRMERLVELVIRAGGWYREADSD